MPAVISYTYDFGPLAGPIPTNYLGGNTTGNFGTVRTALANANTFIGYGVDTGAADAYVVSYGAGIASTLAAGLEIKFKATNANTGGACTINVNGTGVVSMVTAAAAAPPVGAIVAGGVYSIIYNGTAWQLSGTTTILAAATAAQQEAATANTVAVTPLIQQRHPSATKAYAALPTSGTSPQSYNVTSIVDVGLGKVGMNFTVAFSDPTMPCVATAQLDQASSADTLICQVKNASRTTTYTEIWTIRCSDFTAQDPNYTHAIICGDQ